MRPSTAPIGATNDNTRCGVSSLRYRARRYLLGCRRIRPQDQAGDLTIVHPWAMATAARTDRVVAMTIENDGTTSDRPMGTTSPVAERVELHEHRNTADST